MVLFIAQIEEGFASKIIDLHLTAVMEEGACYCCFTWFFPLVA
jgi:hypothetical protein